jgi:hypothetical protein
MSLSRCLQHGGARDGATSMRPRERRLLKSSGWYRARAPLIDVLKDWGVDHE